MKRFLQIINFTLLPAFAILAPDASAQNAVEDSTSISPPALVECRTDADCDRNPKHLEDFIVKFYIWYVADIQELRHDRSHAYFKKQDEILNGLLSPEASALYRKSEVTMDGENGAPYCSDTDSQLLFCTLYPPDAWMGKISTQLENIGSDISEIVVLFPKSRVSEKIMPAYKLSVRLKLTEGAWRIDKVTDILR